MSAFYNADEILQPDICIIYHIVIAFLKKIFEAIIYHFL